MKQLNVAIAGQTGSGHGVIAEIISKALVANGFKVELINRIRENPEEEKVTFDDKKGRLIAKGVEIKIVTVQTSRSQLI